MANYTTNPTCTQCGFKLKRGEKIPGGWHIYVKKEVR